MVYIPGTTGVGERSRNSMYEHTNDLPPSCYKIPGEDIVHSAIVLYTIEDDKKEYENRAYPAINCFKFFHDCIFCIFRNF